MTRKTTAKVHMIGVLTSFNELRRGEVHAVELDTLVRGWINAGLVTDLGPVEAEVTGSGESEAGPGSAEPDSDGGAPGEG